MFWPSRENETHLSLVLFAVAHNYQGIHQITICNDDT
jgi:hypothetical protein